MKLSEKIGYATLAAGFVLLGALVPFAPMEIAVALILVFVFIISEITLPTGSVIFLLALTNTVIPYEILPQVPLGGGVEVCVTDLLLLYLVGSYIMRANRKTPVDAPVSIPLIFLCGIAAMNAVYSVVFTGSPLSEAGTELRPYFYLLACLPALFRIKTGSDPLKFEKIFCWMGVATALVVIAQWFSGGSLFFAQNIREYTLSDIDPSLTRVKPPGLTFMHIAFMLVLARFLSEKKNTVLNAAFLVILGTALAVSFHRYIIITVMLGGAYMLLRMPVAEKSRMYLKAAAAGIVLAVGLAGAIATMPRVGSLAESLAERILSLGDSDELEDSYSMLNRVEEYEAAAVSIRAHPLAGIGLGNAYRGETRNLLNSDTHLHNAYVLVQLKMGAVGFLAFLWFLLAFVRWWLRNGAAPENCLDPVLHMALGVSFVSLMLTNLLSATFVTMSGAPATAVMMALGFANCRMRKQAADPPRTSG